MYGPLPAIAAHLADRVKLTHPFSSHVRALSNGTATIPLDVLSPRGPLFFFLVRRVGPYLADKPAGSREEPRDNSNSFTSTSTQSLGKFKTPES